MVKDIYYGTSDSDPEYLTVFGNTLYFVANDGTNGRELWKSDGTENGHGDGQGYQERESVVVGHVYLTVCWQHSLLPANDGTHGDELWKSDGTEMAQSWSRISTTEIPQQSLNTSQPLATQYISQPMTEFTVRIVEE